MRGDRWLESSAVRWSLILLVMVLYVAAVVVFVGPGEPVPTDWDLATGEVVP